VNARWIECQCEADMQAILENLEYPHWIMATGAFLVMAGFIGFAFRKKKERPPHHG
jgi:LPXTG-motif cell wall-anchored protein